MKLALKFQQIYIFEAFRYYISWEDIPFGGSDLFYRSISYLCISKISIAFLFFSVCKPIVRTYRTISCLPCLFGRNVTLFIIIFDHLVILLHLAVNLPHVPSGPERFIRILVVIGHRALERLNHCLQKLLLGKV